MSRRRHDASDWDGDLAGMWMGDRQIPPPRRPGKGPVPWLILSAACAIGIIMVTGYAPVIRSLLPIALAAYALFAPDIDFTTLARYVPRRLIDFFR